VIFRGLVVAISGFLFIFAPGLPIGLFSRRLKMFNRNLLYWGIGAWVVAQIPAIFSQSIIYHIAEGSPSSTSDMGEAVGYFLPLLGSLVTAIFVEGALYLVLRRKRLKGVDQVFGSLFLGFGSALLVQVFTGLQLVGAGLPLIFQDITSPVIKDLAQVPLIDLLTGLLALILFRVALLVLGGVIGVLIARAVSSGCRYFWLAVVVDTLFGWVLLVIQMILGLDSPGQLLVGRIDLLGAVVAIGYYMLAFVLAYRWLLSRILVRDIR